MASKYGISENPNYPQSIQHGDVLLTDESMKFAMDLEHHCRKVRKSIDGMKTQAAEKGIDVQEFAKSLPEGELRTMQDSMDREVASLAARLSDILVSAENDAFAEAMLEVCYGQIWSGLEIDINKEDEHFQQSITQDIFRRALLLTSKRVRGNQKIVEEQVGKAVGDSRSALHTLDTHLL